MKELVFFSNNKNKIFEINNFFKKTPFKIINLSDYKKIISPKETGHSFNDNAKIKALYGYKTFKKPCFADDSGICIEALDNKPGINSKKFLHENGGINKAFKKIILTIGNKGNFKAFFQTSISLVLNDKESFFFEGKINGSISKKIKGEYGFGYDPIFIPENNKKTFAEMTSEEKNIYSHRSIAIKKLKKHLQKLI